MNPIFRKEVITSLRSNRALWLQILFVATLAGMAIILWPSEGIYSLAARSSGQLPILLALGQLALVCLFAPAFTAPSLTSEVEKNTFDMLFGTQLRPAEIAFGKMAGGLTFLLLVVLSSVPVVGLCFVLGGVTARDASLIYAILVVTALLYGLLGLTISGLARRSYQAVIATYAATLLLAVGVLVPAMMWWERAGPSGRLFVHVLESLSPFRAMVSVIRPDFARVAEGKVVTLSAEWRFFLPVALVGIVSLALVLCWLLRRPPQPPRRTIRAAVEDRPRRERIARRLFFVIDPHRRRRPIGQLANPVLIKELRSRPLGSGHRDDASHQRLCGLVIAADGGGHPGHALVQPRSCRCNARGVPADTGGADRARVGSPDHQRRAGKRRLRATPRNATLKLDDRGGQVPGSPSASAADHCRNDGCVCKCPLCRVKKRFGDRSRTACLGKLLVRR